MTVEALTQRRQGIKTVWRDLSARARLGESFGWIDCVSLIYSMGFFQDRETALEMLFRKATAEDIREYRRVKGVDPLISPNPPKQDGAA